MRIEATARDSDWSSPCTVNGIGIDQRVTRSVSSRSSELHRRQEYPGAGVGWRSSERSWTATAGDLGSRGGGGDLSLHAAAREGLVIPPATCAGRPRSLVEDNPPDARLIEESCARGRPSSVRVLGSGDEALSSCGAGYCRGAAPQSRRARPHLPAGMAREVLGRSDDPAALIPVVVLTTSGAPTDVQQRVRPPRDAYIITDELGRYGGDSGPWRVWLPECPFRIILARGGRRIDGSGDGRDGLRTEVSTSLVRTTRRRTARRLALIRLAARSGSQIGAAADADLAL